VCVLMPRGIHAAAARSSLPAPRITILSASSGLGRCNALASWLPIERARQAIARSGVDPMLAPLFSLPGGSLVNRMTTAAPSM
jgi:hypothetical protein